MSRGLATTTVVHRGRPLLVARPSAGQDGHLALEMALEMALSLAMARQDGASVHFVRPAGDIGNALFELESPDVPIVRVNAAAGSLLRVRLGAAAVSHAFRDWRDDVGNRVRREIATELGRHLDAPGLAAPVRSDLRRARDGMRAAAQATAQRENTGHGYLRRRLLRDPMTVRLRPAAAADASRQAEAHGIDPAAPLVCVHSLEPVESYVDAIDEMVGRGYTVIRLGDPSMTKGSQAAALRRPGVIDLATSPRWSNLLEIHCLLRSDLIVAGEPGLFGVALLVDTPMLAVNVTEPITSYPIRAPGLFVPKTIRERKTGRTVSPLEQLEVRYQTSVGDQRRYLYFDTPPQVIADAAREMVDWIEGTWTESAGQREYHEAVAAAAPALRGQIAHARTWGSDDGFVGDGRIARAGLL